VCPPSVRVCTWIRPSALPASFTSVSRGVGWVRRSWLEVRAVREIRRAGRRLGYRGMLVVFGIATVTLLAASSTGSAHATRVIQLKGHGPKELPHFKVTAPSTMLWTNSGSFFQISSSGGYCFDGAVTSEAH